MLFAQHQSGRHGVVVDLAQHGAAGLQLRSYLRIPRVDHEQQQGPRASARLKRNETTKSCGSRLMKPPEPDTSTLVVVSSCRARTGVERGEKLVFRRHLTPREHPPR